MAQSGPELRDRQDRPEGGVPAESRRPSAEFLDADGETLLRVELPGVDPDAVDLRWDRDDGLLTVVADPDGGEPTHFRQFRLPATFDPGEVSAAFESGVLEVTLPLDPEETSPGRSIEVRGETESRIDRLREEIDALESEIADRVGGDGGVAGEMVADLRDRVDDLAESLRR